MIGTWLPLEDRRRVLGGIVVLLVAGGTTAGAAAASGASPPPAVTVAACDGVRATGPFTVVDRTEVLDGRGRPFIPYGPSVAADLDGTRTTAARQTMDEDEMDWAAGDWCSNVVRIQVNQDLLFGNSASVAGQVSTAALEALTGEVNHAIHDGLVVVLNDSTESSADANDEKGPTNQTFNFWKLMTSLYGSGDGPAHVIFDLFNEPREGMSKPPTAADWRDWHTGAGNYKGMQALANSVRNTDGAGNLLWIEGPHYSDSLAMLRNAKYRITGVSGIVYAIHHPLMASPSNPPGNACKDKAHPKNVDNQCVWAYDFGFLVTDHIAPVVVGEWTNRELGQSDPADLDACWGDAPTQVPLFLDYLGSHRIGLSVYTFNSGYMLRMPPKRDQLPNPLQPTLITSAWTCSQGAITTFKGTEGAGQDVYNFFKRENQAPAPPPVTGHLTISPRRHHGGQVGAGRRAGVRRGVPFRQPAEGPPGRRGSRFTARRQPGEDRKGRFASRGR